MNDKANRQIGTTDSVVCRNIVGAQLVHSRGKIKLKAYEGPFGNPHQIQQALCVIMFMCPNYASSVPKLLL